MKKTLQVAVMLIAGIRADAQGTFQNLGFESANVAPGIVAYGGIPASVALPYWTVTVNGTETTVGCNVFNEFSPSVALISPGSDAGFIPIAGTYDVVLDAAGPNPVGASGYAAISQSGLIPAGTQSLLFDATQSPTTSSGILTVMLGNQVVPITPVATESFAGGSYSLYKANISAWADQTAQLTFTALAPSGFEEWNAWFIDDISFSPNAVPEPSSLVLMGIGAITVLMRLKPKSS